MPVEKRGASAVLPVRLSSIDDAAARRLGDARAGRRARRPSPRRWCSTRRSPSTCPPSAWRPHRSSGRRRRLCGFGHASRSAQIDAMKAASQPRQDLVADGASGSARPLRVRWPARSVRPSRRVREAPDRHLGHVDGDEIHRDAPDDRARACRRWRPCRPGSRCCAGVRGNAVGIARRDGGDAARPPRLPGRRIADASHRRHVAHLQDAGVNAHHRLDRRAMAARRPGRRRARTQGAPDRNGSRGRASGRRRPQAGGRLRQHRARSVWNACKLRGVHRIAGQSSAQARWLMTSATSRPARQFRRQGQRLDVAGRHAEPVEPDVDVQRCSGAWCALPAHGPTSARISVEARQHRDRADRRQLRRPPRQQAVEHVDCRAGCEPPCGFGLGMRRHEERAAASPDQRRDATLGARAVGVGLDHGGAFGRARRSPPAPASWREPSGRDRR